MTTYLKIAYRRALVAYMLCIVGGCVSTFDGPYRYIHLVEQPGILVTRQAMPKIRGVTLAEVLPVQYEIHRSEYVVLVSIPTDTHLPAIDLSARSVSGVALKVMRADGANLKISSYKRTRDDDDLRFVWLGIEESTAEQVIRIRLFDASGKNIGNEVLGFSLVENGQYRVKVTDAP